MEDGYALRTELRERIDDRSWYGCLHCDVDRRGARRRASGQPGKQQQRHQRSVIGDGSSRSLEREFHGKYFGSYDFTDSDADGDARRSISNSVDQCEQRVFDGLTNSQCLLMRS